MNILVVLIPVSVALGALGLLACIWTLRAGQYEDLEGDAARILLDRDDDMPGGGPGTDGEEAPEGWPGAAREEQLAGVAPPGPSRNAEEHRAARGGEDGRPVD